VSEQIVSSNPSISVDLAHDRGKITVDNEPHGSFLPTAQISRQWRRGRCHSIHVERHAYR
jgi:hypothetical protein